MTFLLGSKCLVESCMGRRWVWMVAGRVLTLPTSLGLRVSHVQCPWVERWLEWAW